MEFNLTINLDNAAFDDGNGEGNLELARILRAAAKKVTGITLKDISFNCRDINGNTVGHYEVSGQ